MKITINGGHCPRQDSGAVGQTGLQEAYVTHDVMQHVMYYLQQVGYETLQVQENELADITNASNEWGADLFVSIHCNGADNRSARGTETFCYQFGGDSDRLAQCIQSQIVTSMGTVDRGVKAHSGLYVLRNTDCPAVLVELAFISNDEDETLLASEEKKDEFAKAIARGVTDYVATLK